MKELSYFLKVFKTKFEQPKMEILEWKVSKEGIQVDPSKIAGITKWPRQLKNVKEV